MSYLRALLLVVWAVLLLFAGPRLCLAQDFDVLVQRMNGTLVTGMANLDSDQWELGLRVFHRGFDTDYAIDDPGFNSLAASSPSMPAGAQALPGGTNLSWDFLPMTINNTLSQNLFYWNGQDTDGVPGLTPNDVEFGPLPGPNYTLSLFDKTNAKFSVNGANAVVTGGVIATTNSDGSLHQHRFFFLEDGDGEGGTVPVDGIYLLALRLKMPGLTNSLPVFMIFGTPGSSISAEDDAAFPWVQQQLTLPGDYNQNGVVDAADYTIWRKTLNSLASPAGSGADGNGDGTIGAGDYTFWRQRFGQTVQLVVNPGLGSGSSEALESGSVPEPWSGWLLFLGWSLALGCTRMPRKAL
jgi:Dockerin type I domain